MNKIEKNISLKSRMVYLINLFIAVLLIIIAIGTYYFFKDVVKKLILENQYSLIKELASNLDHQILLAQTSIRKISTVFQYERIKDKVYVQDWIENKPGIQTYFNNSVSVISSEGDVIASNPISFKELYRNCYSENFFKKAITGETEQISYPYFSKLNNQPVVLLSHQIKNQKGEIIGLICGEINILDSNGIFGSLRKVKFGNSGYMYMFSKDRTMILHPELSRILKNDVKAGVNKMYDKALEGFEGSGETINSKGISYLASFKKLNTTGWIIGANYLQEEAYEPINTFRNYFIAGMSLVLLMAIILLSKLSYQVFSKITDYIDHINKLAKIKGAKLELIEDIRSDELGQLALSFNNLMLEISIKDEEQNILMKKLIESNNEINKSIEEKNILINQMSASKVILEKTINEKNKFFSIIAHDLRSPFNGFLNITKLMSDEIHRFSQKELIDLSNSLYNSANNLYKLLSNLLEWTRLQGGRFQIDPYNFNINEIIISNIEIQKEVSKQKEISIFNNIPPNVYVNCDFSMMNTVVRNLLSNSIKFTHRGGKIEIGFTENISESSFYIFFVKDNGIGMDKITLDNLFKIDVKVTRLGTESELGSGLGLLLCKEFIHKNGGELWVESQVNIGTTFFFTIKKS